MKTRLRYTNANYGLRMRANGQTNNLASPELLIVSPTMLSDLTISPDGLSYNCLLQWMQQHGVSSNTLYYYPYRAFGGQNKIVYSTRFVRRAIYF